MISSGRPVGNAAFLREFSDQSDDETLNLVGAEDRVERGRPAAAAVRIENHIGCEKAGECLFVRGCRGLGEAQQQIPVLVFRRLLLGAVFLHAFAGARDELAARGLGFLQHRGDGRVVAIEGVMQDERRTFLRRQPFEHKEQRQRQIGGEFRARGRRIGGEGARIVGQDRLRQPRSHINLPPRARRPQRVQRKPDRDGRKPGMRIADVCAVHAAPFDPGLLHDIFRRRHLAQHAIGKAQKMRAFGFEYVRRRHAACLRTMVSSDTLILAQAAPWPKPRFSAG